MESHVPTGSLGGVQFKWYKLTTNFDLFERDELGQKASTPASNAFTYADQFYNALLNHTAHMDHFFSL